MLAGASPRGRRSPGWVRQLPRPAVVAVSDAGFARTIPTVDASLADRQPEDGSSGCRPTPLLAGNILGLLGVLVVVKVLCSCMTDRHARGAGFFPRAFVLLLLNAGGRCWRPQRNGWPGFVASRGT